MCIEKYGNENFRNIAKSKQTKLEKYGNENFNNRDEAKKTMLKKYGVDNVSKHDEIKQKKQTTFQINYPPESEERTQLGKTRSKSWKENDVASIIKKTKNTMIDRYGVDNPLKVKAIADEVSRKNKENADSRLEKTKKTMQERYGVDYAMQVVGFHEKQQKNTGNYTPFHPE